MNAIDRVRELLDEYAKIPIATGPVELSPTYLRAVERIENLPQNQPRADKSWVPTLLKDSEAMYRGAVRKQ